MLRPLQIQLIFSSLLPPSERFKLDEVDENKAELHPRGIPAIQAKSESWQPSLQRVPIQIPSLFHNRGEDVKSARDY